MLGAKTPCSRGLQLGCRMIDKELLEMLRCPISGGQLQYDGGRQELVSVQAVVAYPVRDGIPVLLIDESRKLDDAECEKYGIELAGDK